MRDKLRSTKRNKPLALSSLDQEGNALVYVGLSVLVHACLVKVNLGKTFEVSYFISHAVHWLLMSSSASDYLVIKLLQHINLTSAQGMQCKFDVLAIQCRAALLSESKLLLY